MNVFRWSHSDLVRRHRGSLPAIFREVRRGQVPSWFRWIFSLAAVSLIVGTTGCKSTTPTPLTDEERKPYTTVGIQSGDILRIMFPGAVGMNTVQQVQADGTIALPLGESLQVRDKTAPEVEKELLRIYGDQLRVQTVAVSVESAGFPVWVSGAVGRPGRVQCRESITVLEVIGEAGGPVEGRADMRRVRVVRQLENGTTKTYQLDLKSPLRGEMGTQFYVHPSDVIYIPERLSFY